MACQVEQETQHKGLHAEDNPTAPLWKVLQHIHKSLPVVRDSFKNHGTLTVLTDGVQVSEEFLATTLMAPLDCKSSFGMMAPPQVLPFIQFSEDFGYRADV